MEDSGTDSASNTGGVSEESEVACNACGFEASYVPEGMVPCAKCQAVHYCSVHCLQWDWKSGGHSKVCDQMRAERLEQEEEVEELVEEEVVEETVPQHRDSVGDMSAVSMDVDQVFGPESTESSPKSPPRKPAPSVSMKEKQKLWEDKMKSAEASSSSSSPSSGQFASSRSSQKSSGSPFSAPSPQSIDTSSSAAGSAPSAQSIDTSSQEESPITIPGENSGSLSDFLAKELSPVGASKADKSKSSAKSNPDELPFIGEEGQNDGADQDNDDDSFDITDGEDDVDDMSEESGMLASIVEEDSSFTDEPEAEGSWRSRDPFQIMTDSTQPAATDPAEQNEAILEQAQNAPAVQLEQSQKPEPMAVEDPQEDYSRKAKAPVIATIPEKRGHDEEESKSMKRSKDTTDSPVSPPPTIPAPIKSLTADLKSFRAVYSEDDVEADSVSRRKSLKDFRGAYECNEPLEQQQVAVSSEQDVTEQQKKEALKKSINTALRDFEKIYGEEAAKAAFLRLTQGIAEETADSDEQEQARVLSAMLPEETFHDVSGAEKASAGTKSSGMSKRMMQYRSSLAQSHSLRDEEDPEILDDQTTPIADVTAETFASTLADNSSPEPEDSTPVTPSPSASHFMRYRQSTPSASQEVEVDTQNNPSDGKSEVPATGAVESVGAAAASAALSSTVDEDAPSFAVSSSRFMRYRSPQSTTPGQDSAEQERVSADKAIAGTTSVAKGAVVSSVLVAELEEQETPAGASVSAGSRFMRYRSPQSIPPSEVKMESVTVDLETVPTTEVATSGPGSSRFMRYRSPQAAAPVTHCSVGPGDVIIPERADGEAMDATTTMTASDLPAPSAETNIPSASSSSSRFMRYRSPQSTTAGQDSAESQGDIEGKTMAGAGTVVTAVGVGYALESKAEEQEPSTPATRSAPAATAASSGPSSNSRFMRYRSPQAAAPVQDDQVGPAQEHQGTGGAMPSLAASTVVSSAVPEAQTEKDTPSTPASGSRFMRYRSPPSKSTASDDQEDSVRDNEGIAAAATSATVVPTVVSSGAAQTEKDIDTPSTPASSSRFMRYRTPPSKSNASDDQEDTVRDNEGIAAAATSAAVASTVVSRGAAQTEKDTPSTPASSSRFMRYRSPSSKRNASDDQEDMVRHNEGIAAAATSAAVASTVVSRGADQTEKDTPSTPASSSRFMRYRYPETGTSAVESQQNSRGVGNLPSSEKTSVANPQSSSSVAPASRDKKDVMAEDKVKSTNTGRDMAIAATVGGIATGAATGAILANESEKAGSQASTPAAVSSSALNTSTEPRYLRYRNSLTKKSDTPAQVPASLGKPQATEAEGDTDEGATSRAAVTAGTLGVAAAGATAAVLLTDSGEATVAPSAAPSLSVGDADSSSAPRYFKYRNSLVRTPDAKEPPSGTPVDAPHNVLPGDVDTDVPASAPRYLRYRDSLSKTPAVARSSTKSGATDVPSDENQGDSSSNIALAAAVATGAAMGAVVGASDGLQDESSASSTADEDFEEKLSSYLSTGDQKSPPGAVVASHGASADQGPALEARQSQPSTQAFIGAGATSQEATASQLFKSQQEVIAAGGTESRSLEQPSGQNASPGSSENGDIEAPSPSIPPPKREDSALSLDSTPFHRRRYIKYGFLLLALVALPLGIGLGVSSRNDDDSGVVVRGGLGDAVPSVSPTLQTAGPTQFLRTREPSPVLPGETKPPVDQESATPSSKPTASSESPTAVPTSSSFPTASFSPSTVPTMSHAPVESSSAPSYYPSLTPSTKASQSPSSTTSVEPTVSSSTQPSMPPSGPPVDMPTSEPSQPPVETPTPSPIATQVPTRPLFETDAPTAAPSVPRSPEAITLRNEVRSLLSAASFDGGTNIRTSGTPQSLAFEWLVTDPDVETMSDDRRIQRYSLATFFYSTEGDRWTNNQGWLAEPNECDWFSRSTRLPVCDRNGVVRNLDLGFNEVSGSLPPEVALLTSLVRLELSGGTQRRISGSIPSELGLLSQLMSFDLTANALTGTIPPELGNLASVDAFNLAFNRLSGTIPDAVGRMTALTELDFGLNRLTGSIPTAFSELTLLQKLSLNDNEILGGFPNGLALLSDLREINLARNKLTALNSEVASLTGLEALSISQNNIAGPLFSEIGQLTSLRSLDLHSNEFTGVIPSEVGILTNLRSLDLSANMLMGEIPSEVGLLSRLLSLFLHSNRLNGSIPSDLGKLSRLTTLRIDDNDITGEVPAAVCSGFAANLPTFYLDCGGATPDILCPPGTCCTYCCNEPESCVCVYEGTISSFLC